MEIKKFKIATILADADLSNAVDIRSVKFISLILPTLTSCNITFEVAEKSDGTYVALCKADGTAVSLTATTGDKAFLYVDEIAGHSWMKIKTSATQLTSDKLIKVMLKS